MRIHHFATIAFTLLLTACGFQLRGTGNFDFHLQELQLNAADSLSPLAMALEKQLQAHHVELTADAPYSLFLGHEEQERRTVSFTAGTRSAEYMLTSSVNYEVRAGQLPALIKGRAQVQRAMAYNQNLVSASDQEAHMLRDEMRQELVTQLIMRLQSVTPAQLQLQQEHEEAKARAAKAAHDAEQERLQQQDSKSRFSR